MPTWGTSMQERLTWRPTAAGKPTQNACIQSFNGKFRDECLNHHYLNDLEHAQAVIAAWRRDHDVAQPHRGIGRIPPAELASRHRSGTKGPELRIV